MQDTPQGVQASLISFEFVFQKSVYTDTSMGPRRDDSFVYNRVQSLGSGPAVATSKCFLHWGRIQLSQAFQEGLVVNKTKSSPRGDLVQSVLLTELQIRPLEDPGSWTHNLLRKKSSPTCRYRALFIFLGMKQV